MVYGAGLRGIALLQRGAFKVCVLQGPSLERYAVVLRAPVNWHPMAP